MLSAEKSRSSTPGSVLNGKYFRVGGGASTAGSDPSKLPWFIVLLICVKFLGSAATFLLADVFTSSVSNHVPLTADVHYPPTGILGRWSASFQCLAILQLSTGLILTILQKPFSGGVKTGLGPWEWFRVGRHAVVSIAVLVMWSSGLQLAGPLRTIFVGTHYDYVLAGIFTAFCVVKSGVRLRGAFLVVAGIFILLLFDNNPTELSAVGTSHEDDAYVTKRSMGLFILVFSLIVKLAFSAVAKNLAIDVGGAKRLHALSTIAAGIILLFIVLIDLIAGADMMPIQSNVLSIIFIVLFGFVGPFYVDNACLKRMEASKVARIGSLSSQVSSILLSIVWITTEVPLLVTLLSCLLITLGTFSLTSSEKHPSGGGSFVGYSSDGLPLFNFSSPSTISDVEIRYLWKDIPVCLVSVLRQIQEDATSRKILYFFLINLIFTCIEFLCGTLSNSLGLISDGFHMLFDTIALLIGLCAAVMCRWPPTPIFPFGYGRVEVISGFINTLFLLVVAVVVFFEALDRLFDPPALLDTHRLLPVSVMGLIVNLCGIFAFKSSGAVDHSHNNVNIKGVFLHILADTMGSVGVIISSFVIHTWGILIVDPLCSLVVAILVAISIWPLLKDTGKILLLTVPIGLEKNIQQAILQILAMEGVRGYKNPRFWTHAVDVYTGSLHVQVTNETNEQQIIRQVNTLFSAIGFSHFVVQVEKDEFIASKNKNTIDMDDDDMSNEDDGDSLSKSDFLVSAQPGGVRPIISTKTAVPFQVALV